MQSSIAKQSTYCPVQLSNRHQVHLHNNTPFHSTLIHKLQHIKHCRLGCIQHNAWNWKFIKMI